MSRARDLSRLSNPTNFTADGTTGRVGLGSENPTAKLNVAGIVSATAFYGDGSNLEGVASAGLGTALSDSGPGSVIYYTDKILGIAGNITVDVPDASNSNVAYTQYEEISVESGIDFIVADGDDFVPDILGLSTAGTTPLSGAGGRVRADNFTNKAGTGAPTFPAGVVVTGVATATQFSGNVTGNASGTAGGLTGTPDIIVRNIIGVGATLSGVLTYEDVTNIDSVGIVTARTGIKVLAGGINAVGVVTATGVSDSIGTLRRLGVNAQGGAYAFVVGDAGKIIRSAGSGAALTLNQNIFTAGDMISVFNVSGGNNTVVQGTGVTLHNTADAATGTRTIAAKGMCTIVCTASNEFAISGSQLT